MYDSVIIGWSPKINPEINVSNIQKCLNKSVDAVAIQDHDGDGDGIFVGRLRSSVK